MYKIYQRLIKEETSKFIEELNKYYADEKYKTIEDSIINNYGTIKDLRDFTNLPTKKDIPYLSKIFNVTVKQADDNLYLIGNFYFSYNASEDTFSYIADSEDEDEITDFINNSDVEDLLNLIGVKADNIYISGWETSIKHMKKSPGVVYHFTKREALKDIKKDGELRGSSGSGLSNRNALGIFATVNPEEYDDGLYGNVRLDIDLDAYMKGEGLSQVDLEPEPDVFDYEVRSATANFLSLDNYTTDEENSSYTIIINNNIPLKYITVSKT